VVFRVVFLMSRRVIAVPVTLFFHANGDFTAVDAYRAAVKVLESGWPKGGGIGPAAGWESGDEIHVSEYHPDGAVSESVVPTEYVYGVLESESEV